MTPAPCACGEKPCFDELSSYGCFCGFCRGCGAQTPKIPRCLDYPTAVRAWNAMQMAVRPDITVMVPLVWRGNALFAGRDCVGSIHTSTAGDCWWWWLSNPGQDSDYFDDEQSARDALVALVTGEK